MLLHHAFMLHHAPTIGAYMDSKTLFLVPKAVQTTAQLDAHLGEGNRKLNVGTGRQTCRRFHPRPARCGIRCVAETDRRNHAGYAEVSGKRDYGWLAFGGLGEVRMKPTELNETIRKTVETL